MTEKPIQFTIVPAGVLQDFSLNSTSKLLYSLILSLASRNDLEFNETGVCYANNNYLARNLGVTVKTVQKSIKELANNNYLIYEYEPYRHNQNRRLLVPKKKGWALKFKTREDIWKEKKEQEKDGKKDKINNDVNENLPF